MNYIISFSQLNNVSISVAGGKGSNLGVMSTAGFPVPPGFVLTTDAYNAFVKANNLQQQIVGLAGTVSTKDPQLGEVASSKIKHLFLDAAMPKDIMDAVIVANDELGETAVAIRSSATSEDLADASFAGQQDTYLNVQGKDALLHAVKNCWASLWTARAIIYRLKQNIAPSDVSLAVVVQKQIMADVSGIAFSLNPQNNAHDEAVINASFGLGETIVSGQVTPDTYLVEKGRSEILEKKVVEKGIALWPIAGGGTAQRKNENPNAQALTDAQILEVAKLATACETHYSCPMDVEWAIADGTLYLLQARPITTYLPLFDEMLTQPGEPKRLYMDHVNVTQGFTQCLSVLGLDIWGKLVERMEFDLFPVGEDGFMLNLHGRQYINISNMLKGMGLLFTKTIIGEYNKTVLRTLLDLDLKEYRAKKRTAKMNRAWRGFLRTALLSAQGILKARRDINGLMEECDRANETLFHSLKNEMTLERNQNFVSMFERATELLFPANILDQQAMIVALYSLSRIQNIFKGSEVKEPISALGIGLEKNPTTRMAVAMHQLNTLLDGENTSSPQEFIQAITTRSYSQEFMKAYDRYMFLYGDRGFGEIDPANQRSYENLESFYHQLSLLHSDEDHFRAVKEKSEHSYQVLLDIARKMGKEKQFIKHADIYHKLFGYREYPKYLVSILMGEIRKSALRLGQTWTEQGRLDHAADIFWLNSIQIDTASTDPSLDIQVLIQENRIPYQRVSHVKNWPNLIDSRGKILRPKDEGKPGEFVGDSISAGKIRGRVKVMLDPFEKTLEPGEILVTRATEPSWTPVFINASGVILEIGSSLQHGAIIAREYGLPCVSGITDATAMFFDGDYVEVDGDNGIVRMIKDRPRNESR